jgi:signal transduction histidine kinase
MGTIERFFLLNLLRISLVGTSIILITDVLYAVDVLSIAIDAVIVSACLISFLLRRWTYKGSVLTITGMTLAAMIYQWSQGNNLTTSIAVILLLGFIFSILLSGKLMWTMHGITIASILFVLVAKYRFPPADTTADITSLATEGMTYFVLYFIISYCAGVLKLRYDEINLALRTANEQLVGKAQEIEGKNRELLESHEDINELNKNLERLVMEVHEQNEILLKYTYTNAHHLRGPVARLLGLISIHKLEPNPDYEFFFSKMEDQANEIDNVVKQINSELEEDPEQGNGVGGVEEFG